MSVFILLVMYSILSLGYKEVTFDENRLLINQYGGQYIGHHGMHELYPHLYAATVLFIVSIASIIVLYEKFKGSKYTWNPVMVGVFFTGLIGWGEGFEHLFNVFGHEFFHYTHMIGGLLAIYFLYIGTKEYSMQFREGGKPISEIKIFGIIITSFIIILALASQSKTEWDVVIEQPFIYLTAVPTLILAGLTLKEAYEQRKIHMMLMGYLSMLAISVTLLELFILFGRIADIINNAYLYIVMHAFQDFMLSATSMLIISFTVTMNFMIKK